MVTRFFASCACAAMPADAPPVCGTPCAVRSRGRQKPLSRTRARGLWKKLRPVFGCRLPWPDFGANFFLVPTCQLNFKSTCQLKMKVDFQKSTYILRKSVEKVTKYHPISTLQKPDFPRNPGGIFWKYLVPYPYLYPYIYIYIYIYKLILIFLREKKRERERERDREWKEALTHTASPGMGGLVDEKEAISRTAWVFGSV